MPRGNDDRIWFWLTLLLSCATVLAIVFSVWELIEFRFFANLSFRQLHYLYVTRGLASSIVLAAWAVWFVLRERRKSEEELRRSRERYRIMLAHAADAVVLFDGDLKVLEWNPQASNLYGYSREEAVGQPLQTLRSPEREELRRALPQLQAGNPPVELETKRQRNDGESVDVQIRLSSFPDVESGQTVFLEVATDLREKIRLRQKALEIEKLASMGRMAAGTAHTLNTPLATMLLRMDMLKERLKGHPCQEEVDRLESSARFCQDFVQKLLQFSRRPEITLKCVEVKELLDSICTFFRPTFLLREHALFCDSHASDGFRILGDRNQMEAMFAALLMNALDALPVEGGTVALGGRVCDKEVELFVRDNGCGIPEEQLEQIFEPFFTTKKAGHGTGLGLSIVRNIVEEHGGSIRLENNSAGGVTAWVHLPLCSGEAHPNFCANEVCPWSVAKEKA
ncbi:MAG: PAS domain S-box protein [Acidobacteria bacterium]|nr:PAS domain S-box protein [Acidobacteriota bacterium]